MSKKGHIVVISGPSGVGKGTVLREVLRQMPSLSLSVSATTRTPRPGEMHGKEYYFLSKEEFDARVAEDAFLEWCEVHHNRYGTLRDVVNQAIEHGHTILLEIDIQGAKKIASKTDRLVTIFLSPPSFQDLIDRLQSRNTESEEVLNHRLTVAGHELEAIGQYDYIVVNKEVDQAASEVCAIIRNLK